MSLPIAVATANVLGLLLTLAGVVWGAVYITTKPPKGAPPLPKGGAGLYLDLDLAKRAIALVVAGTTVQALAAIANLAEAASIFGT